MSETKSKVSADETLRFAETHVQPALEWWLKRQLQQTRSTIIEASEEERSILQTLETLTKGTYRDPERPPTNLTVRDALALRVERGVEYGGLYDLVDALIMDAYKAGFVFVTRAEAEETTEAEPSAEANAPFTDDLFQDATILHRHHINLVRAGMTGNEAELLRESLHTGISVLGAMAKHRLPSVDELAAVIRKVDPSGSRRYATRGLADLILEEMGATLSPPTNPTVRDSRSAPGWPCPDCGRSAVQIVMLTDPNGEHQHTSYVCTNWPDPMNGQQCGWTGWTVPGWEG